MGQSIYAKDITVSNGSNKITVPSSELKNGVYFINIYSNKGSIVSRKFVK